MKIGTWAAIVVAIVLGFLWVRETHVTEGLRYSLMKANADAIRAGQRVKELETQNAALVEPYKLARKRYAQCVEAMGAAACAAWGKQ